jgi:sulfonate transport system substrate-binding protein
MNSSIIIRRMRRIPFVALILWSVTFVESLAQTSLRVADQKGSSRAVMEAAGVLKDLPYAIDWKEFAAAAALLEALGAGAVDTGLAGDAPFTFAVASGAPLKAIAALRQSQIGLAIVVPKESSAQSFDDLKGKKIATGRGSVGHQLILAALESKGLKTSDVQIIFLTPADAKVAFTRGSVDAWSTWEPYISQEQVLFGARPVITGDGLTAGLLFQVATDTAIREKRAQLEDFLSRLMKARLWALNNVESYAAIWGKLMGVPAKVPLNWFHRSRTRVDGIEDSVVFEEQKTIDLYCRHALIKQKLNAADFMDRSFSATFHGASGP